MLSTIALGLPPFGLQLYLVFVACAVGYAVAAYVIVKLKAEWRVPRDQSY